MTASLTPLRGKRVGWSTLVGLLLVPLTVAGVFLWGLWNPVERLDTVTAAVVNLDEPVELEGQLVPLGRVLAAELIAGSSDGSAPDPDRTNFTWVLTDEADAAAGLEDGRYASSVTIPEDFSAAATSAAEGPDSARKATIHIAESERGRLLDTALSGIVTQTATRIINEQLGQQFVGNLFVGMGALHDGIGEAADGATQLADGGKQLAEGTRELADGATELADGTQLLAEGGVALDGGAGALAGGISELATGAAGLSGGATELATGAAGLAAGADELATGAQDAADGGLQLSQGLTEYVGGVNTIVDGVQGGVDQVIAPLQTLRDQFANGTIPPPPGVTLEEVLSGLDLAITELGSLSSGNPDSPLTQLKNGGMALADGLAASAAGQQELATGLRSYADGVGEFSGGMSVFSGGVTELSSGASQLSGGAAEFTSGLTEFTGGVSALAAQTPDLASGAGQLADGAKQSAEGAGTLAEGLDEAAAGIPNYSEREREIMAETAVEPVRAEGASDELFNASGVPLFVGIALWAGALATFLVLSPLWGRTREAAKGVFALTLRSSVPAVLLGLAQGVLAGLVLPISFGYSFSEGAAFFGLAALAGLAFGLVVQGLSARFGGFGRFAAFAVLVIAFAVGIVSTVPGVLAAVGDASPIGAAFTGFQGIASGAGGVGGSAALLVVWGLGGLALTAWVVARERRQA